MHRQYFGVVLINVSCVVVSTAVSGLSGSQSPSLRYITQPVLLMGKPKLSSRYGSDNHWCGKAHKCADRLSQIEFPVKRLFT